MKVSFRMIYKKRAYKHKIWSVYAVRPSMLIDVTVNVKTVDHHCTHCMIW